MTQFSTWAPIIKDCPQPHEYSLASTLESVRQRIDRAIAELRVRIIRDDNEKRRQASFKSYQYLPFLFERLVDIANLRPITGLKPHKEILQTPDLACVSPETSQKYAWLDLGYDPWTVCRSEPYPRIFLAPYSAYIFVCPHFFSFSPEGITDRCPAVVDNRFVGDEGEYYADSQLYGIFAQLYRFYLQGQAIDTPPLDWNQCILDLTPRESVLRPKNVALWTFCKKSPPWP